MEKAKVTQRLAAILAADVVGYTRLMHDDEAATMATLDLCRGFFRQQAQANRGRVVDTAGDSVLAIFETATGAVRAALAIHWPFRRVLANTIRRWPTTGGCFSVSA